MLGKQLRESGDLAGASRHFMAHLPCTHNPENWQQYYLQQFLETIQEAALTKVNAAFATQCLSFAGAVPLGQGPWPCSAGAWRLLLSPVHSVVCGHLHHWEQYI